jgi:glycosyltransferase involved in cell wall biosynthesis
LTVRKGRQVVIAGDGPLRPELESLGGRVAPDQVRFLGSIEDPRQLYTAADLLVLPSRSEGMPAVIIEAGLVGTPTLASAVGAIPEMIDDGVTGFLAPPAQPAALADLVATALGQAVTVGRRAREAFRERYDIVSIAPQWTRVIDEVAR